MVQWLKDLALSMQWLGWLLWCEFGSRPGNLHMPQVWQKKKKRRKERKKKRKRKTIEKN